VALLLWWCFGFSRHSVLRGIDFWNVHDVSEASMVVNLGRLITLDELIDHYVKVGWTRTDAELHLKSLKDEENIGRFNDCNDEI